jgi:hypothetical protein
MLVKLRCENQQQAVSLVIYQNNAGYTSRP